jgi:hypothetical protein
LVQVATSRASGSINERKVNSMSHTIAILGVLTLAGGGDKKEETKAQTTEVATPARARTSAPTAPTRNAAGTKRLFLDVHDVGGGKVTAKDVARAHQKDLATQRKYGVDFKAYWVDEKAGKIYCLAEAPSAEATNTVHREAHGLLATKIMEVTSDNTSWAPTSGQTSGHKLYLDVHRLGAGKVTAKDVAEAHKKDLAAEAKHDVKYLNYWFDQDTGTVMCLTEASSAEDAIAVHREAHGLIPDSIEEVTEGR